MVLVWRIMADLPNSPNFLLPNFPTIRYTAKAVGIKLGNKKYKILDHLLALSLMV